MLFFDRLINLVSGLGTSKDKSVAAAYALSLIEPQQLEAMYRSDWLSRKIVDIVPHDMTRAWREWQAENTQIEAIEEAERALGVRDKVATAMKRARLYGGSAIFIGIGDADPAQPLVPDRVGRGAVQYLHVLSRNEVTTGELEQDILSPFFGQPRFYEIAGAGRAGVRIHPSRVIRFIGAELPDPRMSADGWGDSILQIILDAIQNAASSQQHVASMLPEAKTDIINVPGLAGHLQTPEGTSRVTARFSAAAQIKSLHNILLLDSDGKEGEIWQQKQLNFQSFPELLRMFLEVAAGAADIPVTRLLGKSPTGLNATGDADIRNYYDHVASLQEVSLRPTVSPLDEILIRHALGSRPADVWYEWSPLWQMSETEKADVGLKKAQATKIYLDGGLFPTEALAQGVRNQLIEDGIYPGIESAFDEFGVDIEEVEPAPLPRPNLRLVGNDAAPRTLYVSRAVLNADEIIAWAKGQGFKTTLASDDLHVTVCFSRTPLDWMKVGEDYWSSQDNDGGLEIPAGGARLVERFDGGAVVLLFSSRALQWRHEQFEDAGASWDHAEYQPHITITYELRSVDLTAIEPFAGRILLGPERFAEVDEDWKARVTEDA
ncbi:phage portal protein [Alsobacter sp. KACC 23698]|uniref:Anti-CBASS protein Acb1 n=1 Tax=Alsobacter sp. KACC 23698 TaxID=3149229 RepID=A0AAU7J970_9HYPH